MSIESENQGEVVQEPKSADQAAAPDPGGQEQATTPVAGADAASKDDAATSTLADADQKRAGTTSGTTPTKPLDPTRPFDRRPSLPAKPRRVRGGVKLARVELDYHESLTSEKWLGLTMTSIKLELREEATEYARAGQAKRLELAPGRVVAPIQGRMPGAYTTRIEFDKLPKEQWDAVVTAMGEQAKFAATLIAGHLNEDIVDLFESLGSPLIPSEVRPSCTCAERRIAYDAANAAHAAQLAASGEVSTGASPPVNPPPPPPTDQGGWCKHAVCLALLMADRLASEPLSILQLRGMPASEIMERLHEIRTASTLPGPPTPVYSPVVKGASDVTYPTLESCLGDFWSASSNPQEIDFPVVKPEVSHPLLRRLGPSPFQDGQFPLVGLLASCYDSISEAILREEENAQSFDEPGESDDFENQTDEEDEGLEDGGY